MNDQRAIDRKTNVTLNSEGEGVEVEAGGIVIRLMRTDEGVVCDMYSGNVLEYADDDVAHMASCYAFFSEAMPRGGG